MSAGTAATKLMTADEFCDFVHRPENDHRWFELVRGEVIELPPPTKPHGVVCVNVSMILGNYCQQRGKGYVTGNDSGVILAREPDTVRGPDVGLYEDADTFEELHPKYGEVPHRLAVEVLSPKDQAKQVTRKITEYLKYGVDLVWLIDPESRIVIVYRRDRGPELMEENQELTGDDILPGLRCRVADFFRLPGGKTIGGAVP